MIFGFLFLLSRPPFLLLPALLKDVPHDFELSLLFSRKRSHKEYRHRRESAQAPKYAR